MGKEAHQKIKDVTEMVSQILEAEDKREEELRLKAVE